MYVPNNVQVYTAAFTGTAGGIMQYRKSKNTAVLGFQKMSQVADAVAQAIDTIWVGVPTQLDIDTIIYQTEAQFIGGFPLRLDPGFYGPLALTIMALVTAAQNQYAAEGITPPPIGGGGGTPSGPDGSIQFDNTGAFGGFGKYDPVLRNTLLNVTCSVLDPADTHDAFAGGDGSTVGDLADLSGQFAFAYGDHCHARGDYSVAMGWHSDARGQAAISMGFGGLVDGQGAVGIGFGPLVIGAVACGLGDGTQAQGVGAQAFTEDNQAIFDHATAMGEGSLANRYGMISKCALSTDNPIGEQEEFLFAHLAGVAGNLKAHNATEISLDNGISGFCEVNLVVVDQVANARATFKFIVSFHTQATTLTIDDIATVYSLNAPGYIVTISAVAPTTFRINVDPAGATANAYADIVWHNLAGIP